MADAKHKEQKDRKDGKERKERKASSRNEKSLGSCWVARYQDGVPVAVALKDRVCTEPIMYHLMESWSTTRKNVSFLLCEVSYSQEEMKRVMDEATTRIMSGPTMYNVYMRDGDTKQTLVAHVWQPPSLGNLLEVCIDSRGLTFLQSPATLTTEILFQQVKKAFPTLGLVRQPQKEIQCCIPV